MIEITKEVITSCIDGDRRSQEFLYNTLHGTLYGIIYKRLDDKNDTDMILSLAFTRIFNKLSLFDFQGNFIAWCVIITKHALSDYYRKQKVQISSIESYENLFLYGGDYFDYATSHNTPVNQGETDMNMSDYFYLLKELLTPREYSVFILYYEGYTHKEIGDKLSISEGTSKWYTNQARTKLINNEYFKKLKS